jgi:hypothetical protein
MNAQRDDLGYGVNRGGNGVGNGSGLGTPPGLGGTPTGTAPPAEASVGSLLKELAHEVPALLRGEVNLAKAEARLSLQAAQQAAAASAIAGAVATGGFIVLLLAAVYGLAEAADMELWLSALIVGTVALAVGMMMLQAAKTRLAEQSLVPRHTLDSLRRDKDALRGRTTP